MKVRLGTIEIDDEERRLLASYIGRKGLATREEVRSFYIQNAEANLEDILYHEGELELARQERREAKS